MSIVLRNMDHCVDCSMKTCLKCTRKTTNAYCDECEPGTDCRVHVGTSRADVKDANGNEFHTCINCLGHDIKYNSLRLLGGKRNAKEQADLARAKEESELSAALEASRRLIGNKVAKHVDVPTKRLMWVSIGANLLFLMWLIYLLSNKVHELPFPDQYALPEP